MRDLGVFLQILVPGMAIILLGSPASAQPEENDSDDSATDSAEEVAPGGDAELATDDEGESADAEQADSASDAEEISDDAWSDDWFDQAGPAAPTAEASPPRHSPLEMEASVGNLSRSLEYSDDLTQSLRTYSAPSGLLAAADLTWFPGAHMTARTPAHLGLTGHFEFGLPQNTGEGIGASALEWRAGLVGRLPFSGGRLAPEGLILGRVEGGQHRFVVDADANGVTLIPAVEYEFVRVALGVRLSLSQRFLVEVDSGVRLPFDEGQISGPEWFPRAQATGLDGRVRLGLRFGAVDVLVGGAHKRYFFSFDPTPEGPNPAGIAAGATDAYWEATLGARYSLPPPKR